MKSRRRSTDSRERTGIGYALVGAMTAAGVLYLLTFHVPASHTFVRTDFPAEAMPSYRALFQGHVLDFVRLGPQYVGSLILRAPFALLGHAFGGGPKVINYATALPCLVTAPILGAWLLAEHPSTRISPIILFGLSPIVADAMLFGHCEDVLGAVLCVAALELALRGQAEWAGLLLGLALVNKSWAIVAAPVVVLALPDRRWRALAIAALGAAVVLVPLALIRAGWLGGATGGGIAGAANSLGGSGFSSPLLPDLLWWFGKGSWPVVYSHYLLILVAFGVVAIWRLARRGVISPPRREEMLLLLAMVFLVRAALDSEDNLYYHVPFLLAVMAYEAGRPARLTTIVTVLLVIAALPALLPVPGAVHALLYTLFAIGMGAWLTRRCWQIGRHGRCPHAGTTRAATVRSSGEATARFGSG